MHVRNHLAVRDVLRANDELRDAYAAVKLSLASDPAMDIDAYIAGKSAVVQRVLEAPGSSPTTSWPPFGGSTTRKRERLSPYCIEIVTNTHA